MIARVKSMLKHLIRSESSERIFLDRELADIASRMYKHPLWRERSMREKGLHSLRNEEDILFWSDSVKELPPDLPINRFTY